MKCYELWAQVRRGPESAIISYIKYTVFMSNRSALLSILVSISIILCSATINGCGGSSLRHQIAADLDTATLSKHAKLRESPIIDIHTHQFNARYLPLQGIALGKRDKWLFTNLLSDRLVIGLTKLLVEATPEITPIGGHQADKPRSILQIKQEAAQACGISVDKFSAEPSVRAIEKLIRYCRTHEALPDSLDDIGLTKTERRELSWLGVLGDEGFIPTLINDDKDQMEWYKDVHDLDERPLLTVRHMMDLGPVYDQEPGDLLLDYYTEQIPRANEFQSLRGSDQIYFVAYNPYRDHWPEERAAQPTSMDIVKVAIEHHGAYGVKLYPPSGYRPFENDICDRPDLPPKS